MNFAVSLDLAVSGAEMELNLENRDHLAPDRQKVPEYSPGQGIYFFHETRNQKNSD